MVTLRPATQDDLERVIALAAQAFNIATSGRERVRQDPQLERVRVAENDAGVVIGTARAIPFAHFYGGRPVRTTGVAGVAVAPEARGKQVGTALMRELLTEQRAAGALISSLYPATVPIYRQCGYGFGSTRTEWKAKLKDLPQGGAADVGVEPFDLSAFEEVNAFYERFALRENGLLQRDRAWWEKRVFKGWDDSVRYSYLVREGGDITGFIVYQLNSGADSWRATVACRDLIWETPGAARALLSLLSLHRSTCEMAEWIGPADEPLQLLMKDHGVEVDWVIRTMIRLLDVAAAFEARGYAANVDTEVTIAVRDPLFPENDGPWRVAVNGGAAKVARGENAEATADVTTWGSIWTGLVRARDAVRVGELEATERAVHGLEQMFAGPAPWISDFF